jgi:hypothetical protein
MTEERFNEISKEMPDYINFMAEQLKIMTLYIVSANEFLLQEGLYDRYMKFFEDRNLTKGRVLQ